MADEKPSGAWGSSFVVLAFAAVSAVYVTWQTPPLNSTRPTDAGYQGHEISAAQDIDARLWQDPFDAVSRDVNAAGDRSPQPGNFFLTDAAEAARLDPALTIAITLPGAAYPETAETRRRLRYAVLAALHVARFRPADEGHIGYFRTDLPPFAPKQPEPALGVLVGEQHRPATPNDGVADLRTDLRSLDVAIHLAATDGAGTKRESGALPTKIPFEQFDSSANASGTPQRVLVLWLDEDFLTSAGKPIASLARLDQVLARSGSKKFAVLGPQDSTTLAAMAREVDGPQATKSCLDSFTIYNFSATAQEKRILKSSGSSASDLKNLFCKQGLRYQQTVNTDDQLAQTLACELMRRDPNLLIGRPRDPQCSDFPFLPGRVKAFNHIVLISDWDTVYGNDLALTVKEVFERRDDGNSADPHPPRVEYFSYLRGLDGRLPNRRGDGQQKSSQNVNSAQQTTGPTAGTPPGVATPENAGQFESAEGQSQFDYLRRLAAELQRRETKFLRRDGSHIGAIGVLGSDVYDKLLILQALRPEFPNASFFTTDLDALLLPDKKSHYTRNLLVASAYGLKPDERLQSDISPFRNSYENSAFVTALLAVRDALPAEKAGQIDAVIEDTLARPLLFQIGRTGPQPLPTVQFTPAELSAIDPPNGVSRTASRVQLSEVGLARVYCGTLRGVFLIPLLLIGCVFFSGRVRQVCFADIGRAGAGQYSRWSGWTRAALVALVALALWARLIVGWVSAAPWLAENGLGEPISVVEGITVWPTVALRSFGILLALFMIWYTVHELETNRRETLKRFNELHPYEFREAWNRLRGDKNMSWAAIRFLWFPPLPKAAINQRDDDPREEKSLKEIVPAPSSYWVFHCVRALLGAGLIFLIEYFIVTKVFGEVIINPVRGHRAQNIFWYVSLIDFLATLFLTVQVTEATIYSRAFIKRLTAASTKWDVVIDKYRLRYHLSSTSSLRDWIDLEFLAQRTASITNLVYFPFIAWAVLIFSRSRLFDDFYMPWALIIIYALPVCILLGAVVAYRLTAEKARRVACRHLSNGIIAAKGRGADATAEQLEELLADMQELREGAFAPWASQPVVRAVLLPVLTYGGAMLVHMYAIPGM